MINTYW